MSDKAQQSIFKVIGPGLLFAGSAVGVSHLVQSTRAGGTYGFALVVFILLALLAKYPAFVFGPGYAVATGKSLLSGYRRQGFFAIGVFGLSTLLTMFIGTAANLLITAGLAKVVLGLDMGLLPLAVAISAVGGALLIIGHYHWLDFIIKILVIFLTLTTLAATIISLPMIDFSISGALLPDKFDLVTVLFIAALVGWMPTPLDVSVWQSQWTVAKMRDTGYRPTQREAKIDFNVGYLTTLILALCFITLGAAVMHGSGKTFEGNPALFAAQVIGLYEEALGQWSGYIVGIAAMAVMFSTYLTILDGFPRGLANLALILQGKEEAADEDEATDNQRRRYYWISMLVMIIGALAILSFFLKNLSQLVDIAATISFIGAPIFAYLNHRSIMGPEVPEEARPSAKMQLWSICGITALVAFALLYLCLVFIA